MTFNAKCSMPGPAALAIVASLLGGCGTGDSDDAGIHACPPVVDYSAELQVRAAAAAELLPMDSPLSEMLSDYAVMRDQAQACG